MNRWDEIQGCARDIASNVHADPEARDAMADDLIKLIGMMIGAVGKSVAVDGESNLSHGEDESAHARYLTGEAIQSGAQNAVDESSNAGCDLDRWQRQSPGDPCRCGHGSGVHLKNGICIGQVYNREPCVDGQCRGFVRQVPAVGWTHVDRRPDVLREAHLAPPVEDDAPAVPLYVAEDRIRRQTAAQLIVRPHMWTPVEVGDDGPAPICDACGVRWCDGGCGDASVGAVPDQDCPVHGDRLGRACPGGAPQPLRACCYVSPCALCRNGHPIGGCCYMKSEICPQHH